MAEFMTLTFSDINASLQIDDLIFYLPNSTNSFSFSHSTAQRALMGRCAAVLPLLNQIIVELDVDAINSSIISSDGSIYTYFNNGDFIMFAKDTTVNTSSLKGYYLELDFENDSKKKSEMFQVGVEMSASSK